MANFMRLNLLGKLAGLALCAAIVPGSAARAADPASPEDAGRFVSYDAFPSKQIAPRKVVIWLPPGYDRGCERYAVLYMHDGQNLFDPATATHNQPWAIDKHLAALQRAGKVRPTIVVGIASTVQRGHEYEPAAPVNAMSPELRNVLSGAGPGDGNAEPLSDNYLRFLVDELKPFVDKTYRTRPDRDNTVVMGSSMGGLISLYALAKYPQVFGGAGCMSTHWMITTNLALLTPPGDPRVQKMASAYFDWLRANLPPAGKNKLYFDHGSVNLDALYAPYQAEADKLVAAKGYRQDVDWITRTYPGADHNETAWRERVDIPLQFLLQP